jgi:SPP1 family predicted phage head-tail adaptor
MNPGKLRFRLQIQEVTQTPDSFGEPVESWRTVATVWGNIEPLTAVELWQSQMVQAQVSHKLTLRYRAELTAKHRIVRQPAPGAAGVTRIFNLAPGRNLSERGGTSEMVVLAKEEV